MESSTSSTMMREENTCFCPQAQSLQNQRNEYTTSDKNIVVIYLASWLFTLVEKEALFKN